MSNRHLFVAGMAILSLSLMSCGTGKTSMFRVDPTRSGVVSDSGPTSLDTLKWKYTAPDKVDSSPVAGDD